MQPRINSQKTSLILMAGIFLGGVVLVRLRLLGLPLERDEGEYAYIAQQLLQGVLPCSVFGQIQNTLFCFLP